MVSRREGALTEYELPISRVGVHPTEHAPKIGMTTNSDATRRLSAPPINSIQPEGMAMTESANYVTSGLYLMATGIFLTCVFWFGRSERQVTRTVNALIRGRLNGYGEQDRARMVEGMRRTAAFGVGMGVLFILVGIATLVM